MFSFFERINYQYIRTNFRIRRIRSYRDSNISFLLFLLIFKNYKCFPFSREKIINIFKQTFKTVATEAQTFMFGFFKKYLETAPFPFSRE